MLGSTPCSCVSLHRFRFIITHLQRFSAFISTRYEETCDKDDDWPEDKAATCSIAIQNEYSRSRVYLPVYFSFGGVEELTFLSEEVMRG